jgi:hypothetical protein
MSKENLILTFELENSYFTGSSRQYAIDPFEKKDDRVALTMSPFVKKEHENALKAV